MSRGRSRITDPDTSTAAARKVDAELGKTMFIRALRELGGFATHEEIAKHLGLPQQRICPRGAQLQKGSEPIIEDSGIRRPSETGCACIVWCFYGTGATVRPPQPFDVYFQEEACTAS